jgi:hypothetical protein
LVAIGNSWVILSEKQKSPVDAGLSYSQISFALTVKAD